MKSVPSALVGLAILVMTAMPLCAAQSAFVCTGQSPCTSGPYSIPGTIQAENYDLGVDTEAYDDTSAGNAFFTYRDDSMDVGQIAAGEWHIGNLDIAGGEWAEYTINVPNAGTYNMTWRYSSGYSGPTTFRVWLGSSSTTLSAITPVITVTSTPGGWANYVVSPAPVTATVPPGANGSNRILRIVFEKGAFNLDWLQFTPTTTCTAPNITEPVDKSTREGNTVSWNLAPTGTVPGYTIQWYRRLYGASQFEAIPNATSAVLQLTNVTQGTHGGHYYATVSNNCPGGTRTSRQAKFTVTCNGDGPGEMLDNVVRAMTGEGELCDWRTEVRPGFANNFGAGGYNMPVLSNAVAFIKSPYGEPGYTWNMDRFWVSYLSGELGDRDQPEYIGDAKNVPWYYGGKELFSGDYQKYNTGAVLAVHYHAQKTGKTQIANLARRWLKATFALMAVAALPDKPSTLWADGQSLTVTDPYWGPFAALAGERQPWGFSTEPYRQMEMAQAVGINNYGTNRRESTSTGRARWESERLWATLNPRPLHNVYGMLPGDAQELRNAILSGTLPPNFVSNYLGAHLRTYVPYHILAWPGARGTLLETSENNSTVPMYGYLLVGQNAYLLYPWPQVFISNDSIIRNGCTGTAFLDFGRGRMFASHPTCDPLNPRHPYQESMVTLPAGSPAYWITLRPGAGPQIH